MCYNVCMIFVHALLFILYFLLAFLGLNLLFFLFLGAIAVTAKKEPITEQKPIYRKACYWFSAWACLIGGVRVHLSGEEKLPKSGRFVYCSNHRGLFDPLSVNVELKDYNISFISKPSNMDLPIIGRLAWGAGYLPIDRENDRNALKTVLKAAEYLKNDVCSIGIYPEGTRSRVPGMLPFKAGSFKLAQKAKVPLVIASSKNADEVFKNFPIRPTDIYIDILEVIPAEKVCEADTSELAAYAHSLIESHLYG